MFSSGFHNRTLLTLCLWLCVCGVGTAENKPEAVRCGAAVRMEKPGLPNFCKVTDDIYRGAQPTSEGLRELKKMGIKTVINLRSFHSDTALNPPDGIGYEYIPMLSWHPEKEDIVRFVKIVSDKNRAPVFVHCSTVRTEPEFRWRFIGSSSAAGQKKKRSRR